LVVGTRVVSHALVSDVPYIWMFRMLLDEEKTRHRFSGRNESSSRDDPRSYGPDFELALARGICLPAEDFMGPLIEARRETVRVRDMPDVPADFAWSVEALSKRYESLVRQVRKRSNMPATD